jgi:hypothetical protein
MKTSDFAQIPTPQPAVPGEIPRAVVSAAMLAERCGRLTIQEIHTDQQAADALGEIKRGRAAVKEINAWVIGLQKMIVERQLYLELELEEFLYREKFTTKELPNGTIVILPDGRFDYTLTPPEPGNYKEADHAE